jgi:hypothetical protein
MQIKHNNNASKEVRPQLHIIVKHLIYYAIKSLAFYYIHEFSFGK